MCYGSMMIYYAMVMEKGSRISIVLFIDLKASWQGNYILVSILVLQIL